MKRLLCGARAGIKSGEGKANQILYFPFYPFLLLLGDLCCQMISLVSSAEQPATHPCRCVRVWGWAWRKRGGYKMREDERKEDFLICRLCEHHHTRLFYWPFPGEGNGNQVQGSCLGNLLERGAWRNVVCGVARVGHDLVTRPPPDTKFSGQQGYQGKQFKI